MYRVLIVEDETNAREGLRDLLAKRIDRYEVRAVKNGKEGLREAPEFKPHIIITDIRMPIMSGLEMLQELKDGDCRAEVLLLTGYADFKYAQKAVQLGVRDYILKPIDPQTIFDQLDRCVRVLDERAKDEGALPPPDLDVSKPVLMAIKRIEQRYDKPISLTSIADEIGISPPYLSRIFAKETGLGFADYLIQFRIGKAKELIRKGQHLKIYEIAKMVGYPDVKYFSTQFKKVTGIPPLSYRFQK
ncbi:MAG: response regulator [Treponemataceae bacterium]